MVKEAFEDDTVRAAERKIDEITELLTGPEITYRRAISLALEIKELHEKVEEYRTILDDELSFTDIRMKALDAKMKKLYKHTK